MSEFNMDVNPEVERLQAMVQQQQADLQAAGNALSEMNQRIDAMTAAQTANRVSVRLKSPEAFNARDGDHVGRWFFLLERYFLASNVSEDTSKISYTGALLRQGPLAWYEHVVRKSQKGDPEALQLLTDWSSFKAKMIKQYMPVDVLQRAKDKIADFHQKGSVAKYYTAFLNLTFDIPDMTEQEMMDRYRYGLKTNVKNLLKLRAPATSFDELVTISHELDAIDNENNRSYNYFRHQGNVRPAPQSGPTPMELGAMQSGTSQQPKGQNNGPRMFDKERERLRRENRCFFCKKPGHILRDCQERKEKQN
jgi:hypothetical protein